MNRLYFRLNLFALMLLFFAYAFLNWAATSYCVMLRGSESREGPQLTVIEMTEKLRLPFDRRSGEDRRKAYKLGYFSEASVERRSGKERRSGNERRKGWVMVSEWSSVWPEFVSVKEFLE